MVYPHAVVTLKATLSTLKNNKKGLLLVTLVPKVQGGESRIWKPEKALVDSYQSFKGKSKFQKGVGVRGDKFKLDFCLEQTTEEQYELMSQYASAKLQQIFANQGWQ